MSAIDSPVQPAAEQPCSHCPWRTANHGRQNADGFYTLANLRRLWRGLRAGERMTCHPTDPRMNEFESAPRVADGATTRECAGALVLQQRELQRFQNAAHQVEAARASGARQRPKAFALYKAAHPHGLTQAGITRLVERFIFGGTALGGLRMTRVDLMQDCSHEELRPFTTDEVPDV